MGIRVSLPFIESWDRRSWNLEGEMEIMLVVNSYFLVAFLNLSNRNKVFEGDPTSTIRWGSS